MPRQVVRISRRKEQPLGLTISPAKGFLDLPRELRDKIYHYSLVASEPIVVWSGRCGYDLNETHDSSGTLTVTSSKVVKAKSAVLDNLALGLPRCCRQISREAAHILYHYNTFRFLGDRLWSPLYAFLRMIREESRNSLRSLEVEVCHPGRVWQHTDGTRAYPGRWSHEEVIPRSAFSQRCSLHFEEGLVEHLDPAIEACFRVIGNRRSSLSLILQLDEGLFPGLAEWRDEQHGDDSVLNLDLPLMIETCRQELTGESGFPSRVEVLWKGECPRDGFLSQTQLIDEKGWVMLDTQERVEYSPLFPKFSMLFTMRRREGWAGSSFAETL